MEWLCFFNKLEHKKATIVCEENGPISLNYNVILTTPKVNVVVKPIIPTVTTKSTLTCTNCGKTSQSMETYHNRKIEVPIVPITIVMSIKLVVGTKVQLVKLGKTPLHYPCIIFSSIEHRSK